MSANFNLDPFIRKIAREEAEKAVKEAFASISSTHLLSGFGFQSIEPGVESPDCASERGGDVNRKRGDFIGKLTVEFGCNGVDFLVEGVGDFAHCSSPYVADAEADTSVDPALTVQGSVDISLTGVGVAGACACAAPADFSEKKNPGGNRGSK